MVGLHLHLLHGDTNGRVYSHKKVNLRGVCGNSSTCFCRDQGTVNGSSKSDRERDHVTTLSDSERNLPVRRHTGEGNEEAKQEGYYLGKTPGMGLSL